MMSILFNVHDGFLDLVLICLFRVRQMKTIY